MRNGPTQIFSFEDKVTEARKNVKKTRHPRLLRHGRRKHVFFDMSAPVRGRCVIFSNSKFLHLPPLNGYASDAEILKNVFTQLKFEVTVYTNRTIKFIKKKLTNVSRTKVRGIDGQPNAFISIILSHGNKSKLFGVEYKSERETPEEILEESDIVGILNNENCNYLRNTPKLIFVQACQGEKEDAGVNPNHHALQVYDFESADSSQSTELGTAAMDDSELLFEVKSNELGTLPTESDMMICYSTVSGYRSYVRTDGSVFGIALARALVNHAHDTDLQSLINMISAEMVAETTPVGGVGRTIKHVKQIPEVTYKGWTKKLFFNPGYPNENPRRRKATIINPPSKHSTPLTIHSTTNVSENQESEIVTPPPINQILVDTENEARVYTSHPPKKEIKTEPKDLTNHPARNSVHTMKKDNSKKIILLIHDQSNGKPTEEYSRNDQVEQELPAATISESLQYNCNCDCVVCWPKCFRYWHRRIGSPDTRRRSSPIN